MLDQYRSEVTSLDFSYPRSKDMSNYDALILASIVEKETGVPEERARVAGVYANRLEKNMLRSVVWHVGQRCNHGL